MSTTGQRKCARCLSLLKKKRWESKKYFASKKFCSVKCYAIPSSNFDHVRLSGRTARDIAKEVGCSTERVRKEFRSRKIVPTPPRNAHKGRGVIDLTGRRFGTMTVMGLSHFARSGAVWGAVCDCGAVAKSNSSKLRLYKVCNHVGPGGRTEVHCPCGKTASRGGHKPKWCSKECALLASNVSRRHGILINSLDTMFPAFKALNELNKEMRK